jgi:hypothetical protein
LLASLANACTDSRNLVDAAIRAIQFDPRDAMPLVAKLLNHLPSNSVAEKAESVADAFRRRWSLDSEDHAGDLLDSEPLGRALAFLMDLARGSVTVPLATCALALWVRMGRREMSDHTSSFNQIASVLRSGLAEESISPYAARMTLTVCRMGSPRLSEAWRAKSEAFAIAQSARSKSVREFADSLGKLLTNLNGNMEL